MPIHRGMNLRLLTLSAVTATALLASGCAASNDPAVNGSVAIPSVEAPAPSAAPSTAPSATPAPIGGINMAEFDNLKTGPLTVKQFDQEYKAALKTTATAHETLPTKSSLTTNGAVINAQITDSAGRWMGIAPGPNGLMGIVCDLPGSVTQTRPACWVKENAASQWMTGTSLVPPMGVDAIDSVDIASWLRGSGLQAQSKRTADAYTLWLIAPDTRTSFRLVAKKSGVNLTAKAPGQVMKMTTTVLTEDPTISRDAFPWSLG